MRDKEGEGLLYQVIMGRKKIPDKKVSYTVRIKPENKLRIKAEHLKIGPAIDKMVEELPER